MKKIHNNEKIHIALPPVQNSNRYLTGLLKAYERLVDPGQLTLAYLVAETPEEIYGANYTTKVPGDLAFSVKLSSDESILFQWNPEASYAQNMDELVGNYQEKVGHDLGFIFGSPIVIKGHPDHSIDAFLYNEASEGIKNVSPQITGIRGYFNIKGIEAPTKEISIRYAD